MNQWVGTGLLALAGVSLLMACGAPSAGEEDLENVEDAVSLRYGVDYSWARPSPAHLLSKGYTFAARYLSYDNTGKNLTAAEASSLIAAGIDVVSNWEWGATSVLGGYSAGAQHAKDAHAQATACGMPPGRPIYFSIDFDASAAQLSTIGDYMDGVASVIGRERTGAYGGYYAIKHLFDHEKIAWGWQTFAWSGGQWDTRAQLRQVAIGLEGDTIDKNEAHAPDFGQWPGGASPPARREGSQAFFVSSPDQHHYFHEEQGALGHAFWDKASGIHHDTWGTGIAGSPVTFLYGGQQHAFARTDSGRIGHWFYDPKVQKLHADTWTDGDIAGDPAALVIGDQQHVWAVDGTGKLQHWWWSPAKQMQHDVWDEGVTGRPTAFLYGTDHHVFVRGTAGNIRHTWWSPKGGLHHDSWTDSDIAGDPAALVIGDGQHLWAVDEASKLRHWWWTPGEGLSSDVWNDGVTGRPTVMVAGAQQHAFARGVDGGLEHAWWDPKGGLHQDTWAGPAIAGDPTALLIGPGQHVWAVDAAAQVQHWWWEPKQGLHQDTWGN